MHPKPSELGSQAGIGHFSTAEGDHAGTRGVVSTLLFFVLDDECIWNLFDDIILLFMNVFIVVCKFKSRIWINK